MFRSHTTTLHTPPKPHLFWPRVTRQTTTLSAVCVTLNITKSVFMLSPRHTVVADIVGGVSVLLTPPPPKAHLCWRSCQTTTTDMVVGVRNDHTTTKVYLCWYPCHTTTTDIVGGVCVTHIIIKIAFMMTLTSLRYC